MYNHETAAVIWYAAALLPFSFPPIGNPENVSSISFQLFGTLDCCICTISKINETIDWIAFTHLIHHQIHGANDSFRVTTENSTGSYFKCLVLLIHYSNAANDVTVHEVKMSHRPFFAVHHSLTSKWSGSVPSFQTYCSKVVDTTTSSYGEKNESCKVRSSLSLYSFESGYARCQCDEYCLKFDDCCPDFTGSLDCLGTIDGLECLVKHESLDDGLNGFNGDNGNPNLLAA